MIYSSICGSGHYLPGAPIPNTQIEQKLALSPNWIASRTGIKQRYFAATDETASDLGAKAANNALTSAGLVINQIDLVIATSSTPDFIAPSTASLISHKLGMQQTPAVDLNSACSGWLYALHFSDQLLRAGSYKHILIVSTEIMSRITSEDDIYSYVVFGDGAGAVVLSAQNECGIIATNLYADASYAKQLYASNGIRNQKHGFHEPMLVMEGTTVYQDAIEHLTSSARQILAENNLTIDDLAWLIPHQANKRILDVVAKNIGIPEEKVIITLTEHANTSSASIPIALDIANRNKQLKDGDKILMISFGSGYSWAASLLIWQSQG